MTSTAPTLVPSWTGVEHRHLASLAAVARTRSFRGASHELACSQSTLSQHVAQLERLLDTLLVDRRRGSAEVQLTPAGRMLLGHVERILSMYTAARADLEALTAPGTAALRVGVADHLASAVPLAVLPALLRERPGLDVSVEAAADTETLLHAIAAGRLDVVVGDPPRRRDGLRVTPLAPEPLVLAVPATWAVARRAAATGDVGDLLEHLPVAVDAGDPDSDRVVRELQAAGLALRAEEQHGGSTVLLAWVAGGRSAAVLPRAVVGEDPRVLALPLDGFVARRPVCVCWHGGRRRTELVERFARLVRAAREHTATFEHSRVSTDGAGHVELGGWTRGRLARS